MKTPTLNEFKAFSKKTAPAARAILMARINAEMTRERVNAYIAPVFASFAFTYGPLGEKCGLTGKIETPENLYLCGNEEMLAAFYAASDVAHREHGFTGGVGYCPALIAENLVIEAENALIELAEPLFGIKGYALGRERTKYIELLLGSALKAEVEVAA